MILKRLILVASSLVILSGCQSLPKDAPPDMVDAQIALEEAESKDVYEIFPKSIQEAEQRFERSRELLRESEEKSENKQTALAANLRQGAIDEAKKSLKLTKSALDAHDKVTTWNGDMSQFDQMVDQAGEAPTLRGELESLKTENSSLSASKKRLELEAERLRETVKVVRAIPADFRVAAPVAYFDTSSTDLEPRHKDDLEQLAELMSEHKELSVQLSGYADARGKKSYNQKLSTDRAQVVKKALVERGINEGRIMTLGLGENSAEAKNLRAAGMQLDRKVVAKLLVNGLQIDQINHGKPIATANPVSH
jgi:outer membrane protein OmpA-like peptidoglycan-associated protein